MEKDESTASVVEHFSVLEDPRRDNRRHMLRDILVIAICAVISGANGWKDVAHFGKLKMAWLKGTLSLELPQRLFDDPDEMRWVECDFFRIVEEGHGRIETRKCWTSSDPEYLDYITTLAEWQGLQSIAMVKAVRRIGEEATTTRRYFISSLTSNAESMLYAVRSPWGIENDVHWILEVTFREDDSRIRPGNGAENFAVLGHIALNLLKRENSSNLSLRAKRNQAAWNDDYRLKVLNV